MGLAGSRRTSVVLERPVSKASPTADRPSAWAQALLMAAIAFALVSVGLLIGT